MEGTSDWERKIVITELMQGHELTNKLREYLNPSSPADVLTQKILSSFNKALTMLKSSNSEGEPQLTGPASGTDSPHSVNESPRSENSNRGFLDPECRDISKKRWHSNCINMYSLYSYSWISDRILMKTCLCCRKMQPKWSEQVRVSSGTSLEGPPDDGNSWRKYGQKDILGAKYPRWEILIYKRNWLNWIAKVSWIG